MTYDSVPEALSATGFGVAYLQYDVGEDPKRPYLVYYYPSRDDVRADDSCYERVEALNVELYTERKDFDAEARVERALASLGLVFSATESWLDTESMYEKLYETEVIIDDD
jgi:hypothetical protein